MLITFLVSIQLLKTDSSLKEVLKNTNISLLVANIVLAALAGSRILWFLEKLMSAPLNSATLLSFANPLEPGYSSLGAFIAGLLFSYFNFKNTRNRLIFFDRTALYLPLLVSIGKLGCLFAGCCHGIPTNVSWAISYHHPLHLAPLGILLHPTQLYSFFLLLLLFVILYFTQKKFTKRGTLFFTAMNGIFLERFFIDFLRSDRIIVYTILSSTQIIALCGIVFVTLYYLLGVRYAR